MARGNVVTARGQVLNFEELIRQSRKPLKSNADLKDKVQKQKVPPKQLNVRGFVPDIRVAKPIQQTIELPEEDAPSVAELTGVTIDRSKFIGKRPENPAHAANETLREILTDLKHHHTPERDEMHRKSDNRRTKKS